jgi:hypothetical protein
MAFNQATGGGGGRGARKRHRRDAADDLWGAACEGLEGCGAALRAAPRRQRASPGGEEDDLGDVLGEGGAVGVALALGRARVHHRPLRTNMVLRCASSCWESRSLRVLGYFAMHHTLRGIIHGLANRVWQAGFVMQGLVNKVWETGFGKQGLENRSRTDLSGITDPRRAVSPLDEELEQPIAAARGIRHREESRFLLRCILANFQVLPCHLHASGVLIVWRNWNENLRTWHRVSRINHTTRQQNSLMPFRSFCV